jgi:hypothetical protein
MLTITKYHIKPGNKLNINEIYKSIKNKNKKEHSLQLIQELFKVQAKNNFDQKEQSP